MMMLLLGCDNPVHTYQFFADISLRDGIKSWLPDFFPKKAIDIKFRSNIDLNTFYVYFSLNNKDTFNFLNDLIKIDSYTNGVNFLKKQDKNIESVWCTSSHYNLFGDKNNAYYLIGKLKGESRYYLTNINFEQYSDYCLSK